MGTKLSCLRNEAIMRPKDIANEMIDDVNKDDTEDRLAAVINKDDTEDRLAAVAKKLAEDRLANKHDTEDRLAAVGKKLAGLNNSISDPLKRWNIHIKKLKKKDDRKKKS
jgi:hypothetical protein